MDNWFINYAPFLANTASVRSSFLPFVCHAILHLVIDILTGFRGVVKRKEIPVLVVVLKVKKISVIYTSSKARLRVSDFGPRIQISGTQTAAVPMGHGNTAHPSLEAETVSESSPSKFRYFTGASEGFCEKV